MKHNSSYNQNNTSHDNSFNFRNELDISNTKKDKTGQNFFKEAYDFDDFQNIGDDKTVKSSNTKARKENSYILKRDDQFSSKVIGNSVLNDIQLSGAGFHTRKVFDQSIHKTLSQLQKEPQFGDRKFSAQQTSNNKEFYSSKQSFNKQINMKGSQLSYSKSNIQSQVQTSLKNTIKTLTIQKQIKQQVQFNDNAQSFRRKQPQNYKQKQLLTRQQQYKQLISMINFYKNESQKMNYQRMMLEEQSIPEIFNLSNSQAFQQQIVNNMNQINLLNNQIQKEKAIEKKMTRVISDLQEQYNQIVQSVQEMNFQRPALIKDQAKVLMDQINQLRKQFHDLQIDNGSLNLSCTISPNNQGHAMNSVQNRMINSHSFQMKQTPVTQQDLELQNYLNSLFQQIHLQNSVSQDPQYIKNLKLSCIKDQWPIYSNKQIIVSVDYKTCPLIKLRIGNKTNQQLKKFTMEIQIKNTSVKYMENQTINKKAFLLQGIKVDADNLPQVFFKINLSYKTDQNPTVKKIKLFCPTGLINFGEFTPLTFKQFQTQMALPLSKIQTQLKPIDKNLISSLDQIMLYIPNLKKWSGQDDKIFGLFMSVFNQGTLIIISERLQLIKISLKNGNRSLLRLLQFILTV